MATPLKIMIVDDSEMDIYILKRALSFFKLSSEIISFQSPHSALEYFLNIGLNEQKNQCPDIIFLDINMPGMSGFQFLEEFKKLPDDIIKKSRFIITSSSADVLDKKKASSYQNVIKYLVKPIDENLLFGLIE